MWDSFRISLESFRPFRVPLLLKPVTGQELLFTVSYSKPALVAISIYTNRFLKSSFSEKATKIWKNLSLVLTLLSKSQNKWDIFFKLSPSHNVLTLISKLVAGSWGYAFFLVIIIRLIGYLGCQQNMLLGVKFTVFLNKIEGVKISILFFCTHSYNQSHSI